MAGLLFDISTEIITPEHDALESVKYRGGNHCGIKHFTSESDGLNINLASRHNLVTDLTDAGKQPVSYEDGECWIILDGEIFNYREIRRILASEGYAFKSESDVEVIAAAYSRWGVRCLKYFKGMFAFCIFNQKKQRFFIARDRLGVKPLYFINRYKCFRVGSEIKQFLSAPGFVPEANAEMVHYYLSTGLTRRNSKTLWKEVYELPPGHYIEQKLKNWSPGAPLRAQCWYQLDFNIVSEMKFEDTAVDYRERLTNSMRDQLSHNYPDGFRLSGDINTAVTTCLGNELCRGERLKTYSLISESNYPDNLRTVMNVSKALSTENHTEEFKSTDFLPDYDAMIYANDFPLEFERNLFNWMLYAKGNCKGRIVIDGEGASQFLFSNIDFYWAYLNRRMFNESAAIFISDLRRFKWTNQKPWLKVINKLRKMTFGRNSGLTETVIKKGVLTNNPDYTAELMPNGCDDKLLPTAFKDVLMLRETLHFLDRCAYQGQCELRHPFLDHKVVELSLRMPYHFKIRDGLTKYILREAFADLLPRNVYSKPDIIDSEFVGGAKWQRLLFHTLVLENIDDLLREPYIERDELATAMRKFTINKAAFSPVMWRLIGINRWKKVFKIQNMR